MHNYIYTSFVVLGIILIIAYQVNQNKILELYLHNDNIPAELSCEIDEKIDLEGREYLKTKKVVIVGLIRNSENTVKYLKNMLDKIVNMFKDYKILIVENDSQDNTRKLILDIANNDPKVLILGCDINSDKCKLNLPPTLIKNRSQNRIRKMVLLRNIYLDYINNNLKDFEDFDYLIALDMDIKGTIYTSGLSHTGYLFKHNSELDGMCANGIKIINALFKTIKLYYDTYAHTNLDGTPYKLSKIDAFWNFTTYPKCTKEGNKVKSCFNGFTIYKLKSLLGKKHTFQIDNKTNESVCEHTSLNEQLSNMYVNPYMVFTMLSNK